MNDDFKYLNKEEKKHITDAYFESNASMVKISSKLTVVKWYSKNIEIKIK